MKLEFLMDFDSKVKEIQNVGESPHGTRTIYVVEGGVFEGPRLKGVALDGGAGDWMLIIKEGLSSLDVRKTFKTDDGALIYVTYQGLYQFNKDLSDRLEQGIGYEFGDTLFQVQMQFETGDKRYAWLNRTLAVAEGRETGSNVHYRAYAIV
ncbi:DUF3237 domain-containing protein [Paremcibacter congregatus]|uniref:DUF3237 domain-containing protein n=1 Tax=Paremcibacter congregatus TaxID=2043170 RepID=UPI003A92F47D